MWKLLILSYVFVASGDMEPRVTEYANYETKQECFIRWFELSSKFEHGETAWCEGIDNES